MPFDGSGNYVPPGAPTFPAVGGTTVNASYYNAVINDLAAAVSLCITRDGQGKPSANINWNGKNLTGVGTLSCTTLTITNPIGVASGGIGSTTVPANGQIPIGNGTGYVPATISGINGITVTNGAGSILLAINGAITAIGISQNTGKLCGRTTAGFGAIEEISIGAGLSLSGGVLVATGGGSISLANLTFNGGGSGAAPGTSYNGTVGQTISYNSVGAAPAIPSVQALASASTVTPASGGDGTVIAAQAVALTLANPAGIPSELQGHVIRIKDNGTPQTITYGTQYRAVGVTLPTITVSNKQLYLGMVYNTEDVTWDVIAVAQQ